MLGILLKLIKVARGALFFQALFECEIKQAFIMWPQPWSPWCCKRGLATDNQDLLVGSDDFLSPMSLSFHSSASEPFLHTVIAVASNSTVPLSFLSSAILLLKLLYHIYCPTLVPPQPFPSHAYFLMILHNSTCRTWNLVIHHLCL